MKSQKTGSLAKNQELPVVNIMSERLTKVDFSNLDKILYPELGVTKAQVIEHYIRMAPRMLDILAERPMVLTRYPDGIAKKSFYGKDRPLGTPSWVETFKKYSESAKREINYIICKDLDTLIWMANLAALEMHIPLSRANSIENPDLVLFDIDPEPPANFDNVIDVGLLLKEQLDGLGLRSYVKTSGMKGIHVVVPVVSGYAFGQTREFVHQIGKYLNNESEIVVFEKSRSKDRGTVFIDYVQNSHGRTMVCPYSLRASEKATVSMPLDWDDIKKRLKPEEFNIFSAAKIEKDPWKGLLKEKQKLEMI